MRRSFFISCESEELAASLDEGEGETGVVIVPGGGQTRFGAHRGFALLAQALADAGYSCLRYDRRGVGDSSGIDPGFAGSAPDLAAAIAALRKAQPQLKRIAGFGLCDGATAMCLHGASSGLDAMILANPWVVEAEANEPPPAAIGRRYREQLLSLSGWKRLLTGGIDYRKAVRGVIKLIAARRAETDGLVARVATALAADPRPSHIVLARDDATAIGFKHEWCKGGLRTFSADSRFSVEIIETDAHSFAKGDDFEKLVGGCLGALRRFEQ